MNEFIPAARPIIGAQERAAVERVLRSGIVAQGPEVAAFESEFAALVADRTCVAVNSGTSALHLGIIAAGIRAGDEVIVPSFTFAATANAVALAGATPVFVDVDPDTFCLDPAATEAAITARTRAIMPVHLYGHPAAMDQFERISARRDCLLFEDAAQAHGAQLNGVPVGAWSSFGAFSFYPTKNMTSGEGGMVTTSSDDLARQVRLLRNQGMERRYENEIVGFNARMTDLHAAIGRVQLGNLAAWTAQRKANAAFFDAHLEGVGLPIVAPGATHVYHQYTIRISGHRRDSFAAELFGHGIGTGVYYPTPVHLLPSFGQRIELPVTARLAAECLSLPVHPSLSQSDLERIVHAVNTVAKAGA